MNAPLTRRALLGATAAIGATTLPAVALTAATPPGAMSPEAAALLREFHDVVGRMNEVGRQLDAAQEATASHPEPEALFVRDDDLSLLHGVAPCRHWRSEEPRLSYGFEQQVTRLRVLPIREGEHRRVARRDEIVGAWDRWHSDRMAAREASGEAATSDRYGEVSDEHDAFVLRLVETRTADPGVMAIKAALVLNMWLGKAENFDKAIERALEGEVLDEEALSYSLMRDLMHQLGADYRVPA